jgi:hypothetical protein
MNFIFSFLSILCVSLVTGLHPAFALDSRQRYSQASCDDLLSAQAPSWLEDTLTDRFRDSSTWAFHQQNWFPVCSLTLYWEAQDAPGTRYPLNWQSESSLQDLEQFLKTNSDSCAGYNAFNPWPGRRRTDQQTRNDQASAAGRLRLESLNQFFPRALSAVTDLCCADGDEECRSWMGSVRTNWCTPTSRHWSGDLCFESVPNFTFDDPLWGRIRSFVNRHASAAQARGRFEWRNSDGATLHLTPFVIRGQALTTPRTLVHELGHACSGVRLLLAANRGDEDAFTSLRGRVNNQCALGRAELSFYRALFSLTGAQPKVSQCISEFAGLADRMRFDSIPCSNGCPRSQMEESFADWVAGLTLPSEQWVPEIAPRFCNGFVRDGAHGLMADQLRCFLWDPIFQDRARAGLGCR